MNRGLAAAVRVLSRREPAPRASAHPARSRRALFVSPIYGRRGSKGQGPLSAKREPARRAESRLSRATRRSARCAATLRSPLADALRLVFV